MIFNSISFAVFFIIVFILYYFIFKEKVRGQNLSLLITSYIFYGFADYKMIVLLLSASLLFYYLGIIIHSSKSKASLITTIGVILGIGLLFYFKYFGFFVDSFISLLSSLGFNVNITMFEIIVPLGISFFTFKLISYIIEISRGKIEPCTDFIAFATYISFFPTIMSGPIDKPNSFLPQLKKARLFNYDLAIDGCRQFLWGLFKKTVLADNLSLFTEYTWNNIQDSSGVTLSVSAILYSFQIYTDFSGYSDMAIGIGKILGINITENFKYPFFSTNIADYWRRWHISLTSWLTDYVFMPLNVKFRNLGNVGIILAIIINMIVVGVWHGANWTYVVFGIYHGILFIPLILNGTFLKKKKKGIQTKYYQFKNMLKMLLTFILVSIGLVIFRAENVNEALIYFSQFFSSSTQLFPDFMGIGRLVSALIFLVIFIFIEWYGKEFQYSLAIIKKLNKSFRWSIYLFIIFLIGMYMQTNETPFIYFKF